MIRIAIVDDQDLIRIGLRVLVEDEDDFVLVGEAANGREAIELIQRTRPDVVLMDIRMPVMDGIEAMQAIAEDPQLAGTRVIVLTTFDLDEYVFDALRAGASGFLIKNTEPADLLTAIRVVAAGDSLLSPSVTRRVIREFATGTRRSAPHPEIRRLTDREREMVTLVAEGRTNDEIAELLVVSPATVRTHVSRAMTKLGARDRAQLVVFAYQSGLAPGSLGP
jgi:DNA-binding NarL/FixJ family response regulator